MQTATILHMSPTERNQDDRPYDDIREMKRQLDKLIGHFGDMREDVSEIATSLKGNEFGTQGLVARFEKMEEKQARQEEEHKAFALRLQEYERAAKVNRRYLMAFFGAVGTVVGTIIKLVVDHLVPTHK
jgi:uncharacterized coiled-coil protein SlyX